MKKFMEKNRVLILVIMGVLLVGVLGISFAYFTIGGKQDEFITFKSGTCLSITITEESDAINLESVLPETIEEGLNHTPYTFKIKNNCSTEAPFQISLESLNQVENSLGVEYIQVSLEDSEGRRITDKLGNLDETIIFNENAYDARKLLNGELAGNSEASYKLRMWLDYDATKEQAANKTYTSKIVVSAKDNVTVDEEIIKVIYQEESSTPLSNDWYQNYTTRVNITNIKGNELKAKYCVSNTVCEPNTDITLTSNSFTLDYPNGSNVVCTQGYDTKGNSSKITCNDVKKIDNEKPTINITSTSSTYNSITVNVSGSDTHSGIAGYKFSRNNGSTYTTKTSTNGTYNYRFTGLNESTKYTIAVQSIDKAGNIAEKVTKDVTTPQKTVTDTILAGITPKTTAPNYAEVAKTDEGVYKIADGMYGGYSYIWRGAVSNNWVKFADMYWRIIRINGDGSLRLIYTGDASLTSVTVNANGITATGRGTRIDTSTYNSTQERSESVGYTYTSGKQRPTSTTSGTSSTIKEIVDTWYNNNIGNNTAYYSKVAMGKYCNDRNTASDSTWSTQPSSNFYYAARERLENSKAPTLSCSNTGDIYTLKAGLITADEVSMAGALYETGNTKFYLYTNVDYWTMSPRSYYSAVSISDRYAKVFYVDSGYIRHDNVSNGRGVRPVINLKDDTKFVSGGTGTYNNPYVVQ